MSGVTIALVIIGLCIVLGLLLWKFPGILDMFNFVTDWFS